VKTPLVEAQIADTAKVRNITPEEVVRNVMLEAQPTKQFVEFDQLAGLLLYLVSDMGASANGVSFSIDGGWTAQ
jgi:3-hydroxybutyrate dehydrogenase